MRKIILLVILLATNSSYAQERLNLIFGPSITNLRTSSNSEKIYKPGIGGFIGVQFNINEKFSSEAFFNYSVTPSNVPTLYVGEQGQEMGASYPNYKELDFQIGGFYNKTIDSWLFKIGIAAHMVMSSRVTHSNIIISGSSSSKNGSNNAFDIKIPLVVARKISKISCFVRYDLGLLNRLKNGDGTIKEFEDNFRLGVAFPFK